MRLERKFTVVCLLLICAALAQSVSMSLAAVNPPTITSPRDNARVSSPLTIKGTANRGWKVKVNVKATFDGGHEPIDTITTDAADRNWEVKVNLPALSGKKNVKYVITATQFISNISSREKTITVLPAGTTQATLKPGIQPAKKVKPPVTDVLRNMPVPQPRITSPSEGGVFEDGRIQVAGEGIANAKVTGEVTVIYSFLDGNLSVKRQAKRVNLSANVGSNRKWQTSAVRLTSIPKNAYGIQYNIEFKQVSGSKESTPAKVTAKGNLSLPRATVRKSYPYKSPKKEKGFWGGVLEVLAWPGKQFMNLLGFEDPSKSFQKKIDATNEKLLVVETGGEGNPGWKVQVDVELFQTKDNKVVDSVLGESVTVDKDGKWQAGTVLFREPPIMREENGKQVLAHRTRFRYTHISPNGEKSKTIEATL